MYPRCSQQLLIQHLLVPGGGYDEHMCRLLPHLQDEVSQHLRLAGAVAALLLHPLLGVTEVGHGMVHVLKDQHRQLVLDSLAEQALLGVVVVLTYAGRGEWQRGKVREGGVAVREGKMSEQ